MKVIGNQNSLVTDSLQNNLFYVVQKKKVIQVWNDMRVINDRIIVFGQGRGKVFYVGGGESFYSLRTFMRSC